MTLLDLESYDLDNTPEPKALEKGTEAELRVLEVREGVDKNGHDYVMPTLDVPDFPEVKDFTYFIGLPHSGMTPKQLQQAKWKMKSFCLAFGLPTSGKSDPVDDWPGARGWAILGYEENEQFGDRNYIAKLIMPK
jgi:hypothetical protein